MDPNSTMPIASQSSLMNQLFIDLNLCMQYYLSWFIKYEFDKGQSITGVPSWSSQKVSNNNKVNKEQMHRFIFLFCTRKKPEKQKIDLMMYDVQRT